MPNPAPPSAHQIAQATNTLDQLKHYLRDEPPLTDTLPLLAPLLDENTGVPILLGDILRAVARIVSRQTAIPWTDETRDVISTLRVAAQEITDQHALHWDIERLNARLNHAQQPPEQR
ncbi:hypothetical protein [Streptomyces sp. 4R-3d]|uniref:hypothetical protein n=1 Tax=Streptomyces sp. 4R-3d TaxID=2559605 RepID=UPI0010724B66|nr:hypothetical protein [Streptomyces sp. 4R-3d]TFI21338.1 hypothetical protein E4P36_33725 [Streptomyces sp. 4R-3d]